jgi:hypothetical protein
VTCEYFVYQYDLNRDDGYVCLRNYRFIGNRRIFDVREREEGYDCDSIFYMSPTGRPVGGFDGIRA